MEYKRIGDNYIIRLDVNDNIIESLREFSLHEKINVAFVMGIGAVKSFVLGFFNPHTKQYQEKAFDGFYEITSLTGNIISKDGEPIIHLHGIFGDDDYQTVGGHLKEATISITCEIFVNVIPGKLNKSLNEMGVNIIKFN